MIRTYWRNAHPGILPESWKIPVCAGDVVGTQLSVGKSTQEQPVVPWRYLPASPTLQNRDRNSIVSYSGISKV
jgi:hypothetical protein